MAVSFKDAQALYTQIQLVNKSIAQLSIAKQKLSTYRSEMLAVYQSKEQIYLLLAIDQQLASIQQMLNRCAMLQKQLKYMQNANFSCKGGW